MDPVDYFHWLVVRGSVGLIARGNSIKFSVDPEGSGFCVLSRQDARELAQILTELSRKIWDDFENKADPALGESGTMTWDQSSESWVWPTTAGSLEVSLNDKRDMIRIGRDLPLSFELLVRPVVELAQVLLHCAGPEEAQSDQGT